MDSNPPGLMKIPDYFSFLRSPKAMILRIREGQPYRSASRQDQAFDAFSLLLQGGHPASAAPRRWFRQKIPPDDETRNRKGAAKLPWGKALKLRILSSQVACEIDPPSCLVEPNAIPRF
jgi:hypothetical protein